MSQPVKAYVALGSNLGDRSAYIKKAIEMLAGIESISVVGMSKIIETVSLAGTSQPDYLNAVAAIRTTLSPQELHHRMMDIENALGRERKGKWSPRTIDLDMLLFGSEIIHTPDLTVPHRQMHLRSFVLKGLCELASQLNHPLLNQPMSELARRLNGLDFVFDANSPQLVSVAGIIGVGKTTLAKALADVLGCKLLLEEYDTNPFLPKVYAGSKELSLDSQLYFLNSRVEQLKINALSAGQIVVSDYVFEKEPIYADRTLDAQQLDEYKKQYKTVADTVADPVLVIYLQDSPTNCLQRIHRRNRPYEQQIKLDFLQGLYDDYDKLLAGWAGSPVIRTSAERFNCTNLKDVKTLADEIKFYLAV